MSKYGKSLLWAASLQNRAGAVTLLKWLAGRQAGDEEDPGVDISGWKPCSYWRLQGSVMVVLMVWKAGEEDRLMTRKPRTGGPAVPDSEAGDKGRRAIT